MSHGADKEAGGPGRGGWNRKGAGAVAVLCDYKRRQENDQMANTKKIVDALNEARARELQVVIQYMIQHYTAQTMKALPVIDMFKSIAIAEMKHAESLGERIDYLGGTPTKEPKPIKPGEEVTEMLKLDIKAEEDAIALYKDIIKLCDKEGDVTSRRMMEDILEAEEEHHNDFLTALGKK
jgi:bacterioferritin